MRAGAAGAVVVVVVMADCLHGTTNAAPRQPRLPSRRPVHDRMCIFTCAYMVTYNTGREKEGRGGMGGEGWSDGRSRGQGGKGGKGERGEGTSKEEVGGGYGGSGRSVARVLRLRG